MQKKINKQRKHGLVYTNLLSLLLIIYRYNYNTSVTCSATMWMFSCVQGWGGWGVLLRQCWSSLVIALQSNDSSTGVHPHCWMGPIPRSLLYHPLSSMWVKQRLYHKKKCCIVVEMMDADLKFYWVLSIIAFKFVILRLSVQ